MIALKFHGGPEQRRARAGARHQRVERRHDAASRDGEAEKGMQCDGLTNPIDPDDRRGSSTRSTPPWRVSRSIPSTPSWPSWRCCWRPSGPQVDPSFATRLDARVEQRFAPAPAAAARRRPRRSRAGGGAGRSPAWRAAAVAAVVVVVVAGVRRAVARASESRRVAERRSPRARPAPASAAARVHTGERRPASRCAAAGPSRRRRARPARGRRRRLADAAPARPPRPPATVATAAGSSSRRNWRSTPPPSRIDAVAQEVFDVVGRENGIVNHSSVTAPATRTATRSSS